MSEPARRLGGDHGWWPYLLPYFAFILSAEFAGRMPPEYDGWLLILRPALPAGLMLYFWQQGRYPELRGFGEKLSGAWQDVAVGLLLTVVWMAPLLLGVDLFLADWVWSGLGPPEPGSGLDPTTYGEGNLLLLLLVRSVGFAVVTPFFEEIFIRGFVQRYADVYDTGEDFRRVPVARYTKRSFWVVVVVFTMAHLPWEWIVSVPWIVLSTLWFYHRRHIGAVILLHATTNAAILVFVAAMGGEFEVGGRVIDLWIFV